MTDTPSLCEAFARAVGAPSGSWGDSLFTFDDRLLGGFGLVAPCEIVWEHSAFSRRHLDSAALLRHCQQELDAGDYASEEQRRWFVATQAKAERGEQTLFDLVLECVTTVSQRAPDRSWTVDLILE